MGYVSVEQGDHLFWLGRYVERVCLTLHYLEELYDVLLDSDSSAYKQFCDRLNIPNVYADEMDFITHYQWDKNNPDSLYSNLSRAYDNGLVLRNIISTPALSYIQMSLDLMEEGAKTGAYALLNQQVVDYLLAFWGILDEKVGTKHKRSLIKAGRYLERLDMQLRLGADWEELEITLGKLIRRLEGSGLNINKDKLEALTYLIESQKGDDISRLQALSLIGELVEP